MVYSCEMPCTPLSITFPLADPQKQRPINTRPSLIVSIDTTSGRKNPLPKPPILDIPPSNHLLSLSASPLKIDHCYKTRPKGSRSLIFAFPLLSFLLSPTHLGRCSERCIAPVAYIILMYSGALPLRLAISRVFCEMKHGEQHHAVRQS